MSSLSKKHSLAILDLSLRKPQYQKDSDLEEIVNSSDNTSDVEIIKFEKQIEAKEEVKVKKEDIETEVKKKVRGEGDIVREKLKEKEEKSHNSENELENYITSINVKKSSTSGFQKEKPYLNRGNITDKVSPKSESRPKIEDSELKFSNTEDIQDLNEYKKEYLESLKNIILVPKDKLKNHFLSYELDKSKCNIKPYNIYR